MYVERDSSIPDVMVIPAVYSRSAPQGAAIWCRLPKLGGCTTSAEHHAWQWPRRIDCVDAAGFSAAMIVKAAQDAAKAVVLAGCQSLSQDKLLKAIEELQRHDTTQRA